MTIHEIKAKAAEPSFDIDALLDEAKETGWESVMILGYTANGHVMFMSSPIETGEAILAIEQTKLILLGMHDD
jgi:hypothetical protein